MIKLDSQSDFSKLLFFNDMYREILGVHGDVLHIGAPVCSQYPTLWSSLCNVYENEHARRLCTIPVEVDSAERKGMAFARLLAHFDECPTVVALAYFDDVDVHETQECLDLVIPHLTRGSVIAFSMRDDGQITAISDVIGLGGVRLQSWHASRKDVYAVI